VKKNRKNWCFFSNLRNFFNFRFF